MPINPTPRMGAKSRRLAAWFVSCMVMCVVPAPFFARGAQTASHREIVIVDPATPDYHTLVAEITAGAGDGRRLEVVVLEADRDGVAQIDAILARHSNLSAIHIISHGQPGRLLLGTSVLDTHHAQVRAEEIQGWGRALTPNGDVLLYGCDVAADDAGRAFVHVLSRLTDADVAASTTPTGSAEHGGDWDLELATGPIEASSIVDARVLAGWSGSSRSPPHPRGRRRRP